MDSPGPIYAPHVRGTRPDLTRPIAFSTAERDGEGKKWISNQHISVPPLPPSAYVYIYVGSPSNVCCLGLTMRQLGPSPFRPMPLNLSLHHITLYPSKRRMIACWDVSLDSVERTPCG